MCKLIPNFRVKPGQIIVNVGDETSIRCSYKQAWILLSSGLLRLLKFWKQFHTNLHITESRGKTLGRRNIQPAMFNVSPIEKWQFQPASHSVIHLCLFSTYNIWHSGNSGWKWYSHVIFGINRDRCFVLWFLRRTLPRTDNWDKHPEKV